MPSETAEQTDRPGIDTRGDTAVCIPPEIPGPVAADAMTDEELMTDAGIDQVYSTSEVAEFFDRTTQWIYWGLRPAEDGGPPPFVHEDGTPISPERIGSPETGRRRFTLPIITEIMMSSYRRGNLEPDELRTVLRRIKFAQDGVDWRQREGWHYVALGRNRHRWVHPDKVVFDEASGEWKLRTR